ncbi:hypothetical protein DFH07DRAFT_30109 [Mycena maculata]|uniref:ENTH domain-containing protein n=1 Tax=Mycena maculata TaxID=230809 RepID=A0AAD7K446_9AGAR|nr:hypothetical protein DFH07DRAFT_30109 [Mycena maculata]
MDRLESLGTTLSQITLYDIKSMYNQAKNVVLNVSEIEAKVREATNDEPWGASSTLMQDIANRTFNYPDFNEIMPSIYARFMEKEARQWRQIYKALQLLEYLIKNGSERVVDDARSHVSTIKMLRNFHYIDDKGKDEGLNVRNRSRELVELLSDVEKIRSERRKAKANKHKYTGTGNDGGMGGMSFASESGGRYGGFGSDSLGGGYSGGGGGGGGATDYYGAGSSSGTSGGFRDDRRPGAFDEYNAGDDEIGVVNSGGSGRTASPVNRRAPPVRKPTAPPPPPAPPVNLFDDDDDGFTAAPAPVPAPPANKALPVPAPAAPFNVLDDDEFDDFQAAPVQPGAGVAAPSGGANSGLFGVLNATPAPAPAPAPLPMFGQQPARPMSMGMGMGTPMAGGMGTPMGGAMGRGMGMGAQQPGHRYGGSISSAPLQPQTPNYTGMQPMAPNYSGMAPMAPAQPKAASPTSPASKPAQASFDDLWSMSLGSGSTSKPATPGGGAGAAAGGGKSIKDLEKEKAMAGLWGSGGGGAQKPAAMGSGMMGMGNMGGMGTSSSSSGIDDLLG